MLGKKIVYNDFNVTPGDFYLREDGYWYGMTPNGLLCNLRKHFVETHNDDTISVTPSILVQGGENHKWHGYLKRGRWIEC